LKEYWKDYKKSSDNLTDIEIQGYDHANLALKEELNNHYSNYNPEFNPVLENYDLFKVTFKF